MGTPLEKLKNLVGQIPFLSNNTVNSGNTQIHNHFHIEIPDKGDVDPSQIKTLAEVLTEVIKTSSGGYILPTPESKETLGLISGYEEKADSDKAKKFAEEKLPPYDRSLWLSALVLRSEFSKGNVETVGRLKREMSLAAPGRGNNIANLCSANYLETHIMPLYEYLVTEKNDSPLFLKIYETIVTEFPFAVFMSLGRSGVDVKDEIVSKIRQVKKYGWNKVSVHGIGESNVAKIREIIPEVEKTCSEIDTTDLSSYDSKGKIITVNFNLKSS